MSTNRDIDYVNEGNTLASQGVDFDLVRPVLDNGTLDPMIWKIIDPNKSSKQGTRRAELAGPRLPGSDKVEQRRQSVTWDRLVFVGADGEPLVPQPAKSAWKSKMAGG